MREPTQEELTALANQLRARRDDLVHQGHATEADRSPVPTEAQDEDTLVRLDALQEQQIALEMERRRQREIARIDAALDRIASGEYGWCAKCGEEIGEARLEADPTTPLCVNCADR